MGIIYLVSIFILGLVVGSFLSAFTYRWPKGISIARGRSLCPHCKKTISWYDNIPLLSFLILRGKCRNCGKKISLRYPLIELSTASLFVLVNVVHPFTLLANEVGQALLTPYYLLLTSALIAIFITDFESMLIPDNLVYLLLGIILFLLLFSSNDNFYKILLTGFVVSFVFLLLHLITRGRGMGLGDVKLVLPLGIILGWPNVIIWLFLSFVIGAVVGIVLISFKKASFGKQIAFGPFLILAFFITLFWGKLLVKFIAPWL